MTVSPWSKCAPAAYASGREKLVPLFGKQMSAVACDIACANVEL